LVWEEFRRKTGYVNDIALGRTATALSVDTVQVRGGPTRIRAHGAEWSGLVGPYFKSQAKLGKRPGCDALIVGASMKASRHKMNMQEMYHFKAVAADHWLEILMVAIALIFVLLQITRQR
jgi:hypothetical protein